MHRIRNLSIFHPKSLRGLGSHVLLGAPVVYLAAPDMSCFRRWLSDVYTLDAKNFELFLMRHCSNRLVMCDQISNIPAVAPIVDDLNESIGDSDLVISDISSPSIVPAIGFVKTLYAVTCWLIVMSIWLAAGFGPVFVLACLWKQAWDTLLSFLCVWLMGGLLKFPCVPWLAEFLANGLENWFARFEINYQNSSHRPYQETACNKKSIYCYHPHGLFSLGAVFLAADLIRRGEKVAFVTSSHMRWFNPFAKLMMDIAGIEIVGATPKEVQAAMLKGDRSLILVPGGYEEAVFTQNGLERLFLKNRLGFVKYAMRYGYSLTPVYAFGENELYTCFSIGSRIRDWLAKFKIPIALFYGHPVMPLMPLRGSLRIAVGEPLTVLEDVNPSLDDLRRTHAMYLQRLSELYYTNSNNPERLLEIV